MKLLHRNIESVYENQRYHRTNKNIAHLVLKLTCLLFFTVVTLFPVLAQSKNNTFVYMVINSDFPGFNPAADKIGGYDVFVYQNHSQDYYAYFCKTINSKQEIFACYNYSKQYWYYRAGYDGRPAINGESFDNSVVDPSKLYAKYDPRIDYNRTKPSKNARFINIDFELGSATWTSNGRYDYAYYEPQTLPFDDNAKIVGKWRTLTKIGKYTCYWQDEYTVNFTEDADRFTVRADGTVSGFSDVTWVAQYDTQHQVWNMYTPDFPVSNEDLASLFSKINSTIDLNRLKDRPSDISGYNMNPSVVWVQPSDYKIFYDSTAVADTSITKMGKYTLNWNKVYVTFSEWENGRELIKACYNHCFQYWEYQAGKNGYPAGNTNFDESSVNLSRLYKKIDKSITLSRFAPPANELKPLLSKKTYSGTKCNVGDIILQDGTAVSPGSYYADTRNPAIGVVAFFRDMNFPNSEDNGTQYGSIEDAVIFGLQKDTKALIVPEKTDGFDYYGQDRIAELNITEISWDYDGKKGTYTANSDTDGSDNYSIIKAAIEAAKNRPEFQPFGNITYPAFEAAENYGVTNNIKGTFRTGWYIPSYAEYDYVGRNIDKINDSLSKISGSNSSFGTGYSMQSRWGIAVSSPGAGSPFAARNYNEIAVDYPALVTPASVRFIRNYDNSKDEYSGFPVNGLAVGTYGEKKEPNAVGDIVFSDGSATALRDGLILTSEQKKAVIACGVYIGDGYIGEKGYLYVIGINAKSNIRTAFTDEGEQLIKPISSGGSRTAVVPIDYDTLLQTGIGHDDMYPFVGMMTDGVKNWASIQKSIPWATGVKDSNGVIKTGMPVFIYADMYGSGNSFKNWYISGPDQKSIALIATPKLVGKYSSGWFIPAYAESWLADISSDNFKAKFRAVTGSTIGENGNENRAAIANRVLTIYGPYLCIDNHDIRLGGYDGQSVDSVVVFHKASKVNEEDYCLSPAEYRPDRCYVGDIVLADGSYVHMQEYEYDPNNPAVGIVASFKDKDKSLKTAMYMTVGNASFYFYLGTKDNAEIISVENVSEGWKNPVLQESFIKVGAFDGVKPKSVVSDNSGLTTDSRHPYKIGDIVLQDGSVVSAAQYRANSRNPAVGVIAFFKDNSFPNSGNYGSRTGTKEDAYIIGLQQKRGVVQWASSGAQGVSLIKELQSYPSHTGPDAADIADFHQGSDVDGSDNWSKLCAAVTDENKTGTYPAFEYASSYGKTVGISGTYSSGWYLPTIAELSYVYRNKRLINESIALIEGAMNISGALYRSSSQVAFSDGGTYSLNGAWGSIEYESKTNSYDGHGVIVIRPLSTATKTPVQWSEPVVQKKNPANSLLKPSSGNGSLIGTKAKPDAVGDIIFSDGSAIAYTAGLTLTQKQKETAVAVAAFVGDGSIGEIGKIYGISLASKDHCIYYNPRGRSIDGASWNNFVSLSSSTEETYGSPYVSFCYPNGSNADHWGDISYFTGDLDGSDNWEDICKVDPSGAENAEFIYPAWDFVLNMGEGWYIGSAAEIWMMHKNILTINAARTAAGYSRINSCWTSSSIEDSSFPQVIGYHPFETPVLSSRSMGSYVPVYGMRAFDSGIKTVAKPTQSVSSMSAKPDFVLVKGGLFKMGSTSGANDEKPVHSVTLTSFYMCDHEVTQAEYKAVMGTNPSAFSGNNKPVEQVSWFDAIEYCNALSRKEGLTPCYTKSGGSYICNWSANGYRLPTEAEWEYAARGGNKSKGYTYSGSNTATSVSWSKNNAGSGTHDVKTKTANELGIYDLSGNVSEWVWDWYGNYSSSSQTDPRGVSSGSYRSRRGGSWSDAETCATVTYRDGNTPTKTANNRGFRVVRNAD